MLLRAGYRLFAIVTLGALITFSLRLSDSSSKVLLINEDPSAPAAYSLYLQLRDHLNPEHLSINTAHAPQEGSYSLINHEDHLTLRSPVHVRRIEQFAPEITISLKTAQLILTAPNLTVKKQPGALSFVGEILSAISSPNAAEAMFLLEWNSHLHFRSATNAHLAYAKLLYGNLLTKSALKTEQKALLNAAIKEFGYGFKKFKFIDNPDLSLALGNNLTLVSSLNNLMTSARDHRRRVHIQTMKKLVQLAQESKSILLPIIKRNLKVLAAIMQDYQKDDPRRHVM